MKGKMIFTDKEYRHAEREIFPALCVPGAKDLTVSDAGFDGFFGFGVAISPSSCYELSLMEPADRDALLRQLFSKEGIGLSVARLCIGSSDYSAELYSYDDVPLDTALEHFSVERDEKYVIPIIQQILEINPELYLFASPWSPPFWMKTGGSMCGGYMREQYLDCYGDYIVKFIKAYAQRGIRVSAITPQNEPNTQQNGKMPACIWHPETEAKFIGILREKFAAEGLDIKIWMHDHNFYDIDRVLWSLENCPGMPENCDGVAFHYYTGSIEQTRVLRQKYPELELHFTEGGPRLNDNYDTDWCKWGVMIAKALKLGYRSFTGWNLMLDETGGPNIGPFIGTCGGLVTRDSRTGALRYSGQYQAFSHIVPYVTPESVIRPLCAEDSFRPTIGKYPKHLMPVEGVVIAQPDGREVAVLVNPNSSPLQTQIQLGGALWYLELRSDTIATVIVEP